MIDYVPNKSSSRQRDGKKRMLTCFRDCFERVFGDRDGTVHSCPECTTNAELKNGAAARGELGQLLTI